MISVLQLVGTFNISGRSRVVHDLCRGLSGHGHTCRVVCLAGTCGYGQGDVPVDCLSKRPGLDVRLAFRIRRLARRHGAAILHSHGRGAAVYAALVRAMCPRVRVVHTVHRSDGDLVTPRRRMREWVLGRCGAITAVSSAAAARFAECHEYPVEKIIVIPNGIDADRYSGEKERHGRTVGAIANFSGDKDFRTLLLGFAGIRKTHPDAKLVIAGDGPKRAEVEKMIAKNGLQDSVELLGFRGDVPELLRQMEVLVHSTFTEGFGLVLLEAMASGVPVVASNVGGIPEIITDDETGLLFPPGDSAALAAAVARVFDDGSVRERLSANGLRGVHVQYSTERMCSEYTRLYCELHRQPFGLG